MMYTVHVRLINCQKHVIKRSYELKSSLLYTVYRSIQFLKFSNLTLYPEIVVKNPQIENSVSFICGQKSTKPTKTFQKCFR